ncbi:MerR family transcriptional regulator [Paenibacillus faecalis]|uniref:MerR family transcriptional regulator n=1 Tax=Paenibacillus faecalis TaxID=2079532 RepID=UPI000D0E359B|nr:MerR family transcriptional regulator [Paenibacillus faecalis]
MYSIGRFSEICNVPVKTLRYYSDIGLLKPSYIDPETNYRYYDYDHIQTVKKIMLLRSCHISLANIKEFMDSADREKWQSILEHKIDELEELKQQIAKQIEDMDRLKTQIDRGASILPGPFLSDCFMEKREEIQVYTIRENIKVQFIDDLVRKLFDRVYAFQLVVTGKLMAIFHERFLDQQEVDVELLLPIKDSDKMDGCRILPAGTYGCLMVKGPYSELSAGYEKLKNWIEEQNLTQSGKAFEIYEKGLVPSDFKVGDIRPDLSLHPSDFITKICIPVVKNE